LYTLTVWRNNYWTKKILLKLQSTQSQQNTTQTQNTNNKLKQQHPHARAVAVALSIAADAASRQFVIVGFVRIDLDWHPVAADNQVAAIGVVVVAAAATTAVVDDVDDVDTVDIGRRFVVVDQIAARRQAARLCVSFPFVFAFSVFGFFCRLVEVYVT
jgi:hypothetical protein